MAQRRMFNKSITNSSKFLKMPMSSRLLYYDLGMNADDDGYVEHFMVLRMTGATQQDLGVLELNGLVKVFDENVLWIKDWKENNYIQKDRYMPSKYLSIYSLDTKCIQDVYTGKVSIGKVSIDNIKESDENEKEDDCKISYMESTPKDKNFKKPTLEEIQNYCKERNNEINANTFYDFYESKDWYVGKNKMKDWKACIRTWEQKINEKKEKKEIPSWFNENTEKEKLSLDDEKKMQEMIEKYR